MSVLHRCGRFQRTQQVELKEIAMNSVDSMESDLDC